MSQPGGAGRGGNEDGHGDTVSGVVNSKGGDFSQCRKRKIVVNCLDGIPLFPAGPAVIPKISDVFFLFGIHGNHRKPLLECRTAIFIDVLKLGLPVRMRGCYG
jgi:hypothetical protein